MTVTLRVYDRDDYTNLLGTLDQPFGIAWSREDEDVGVGEFTIPHDSPAVQANPALLTKDNMIAVDADGVDEFAWLVRRRKRDRGDVWDPIKVAGPGFAEVLRQGLVLAYGGGTGVIGLDERLFGWMGADLDDSGWYIVQDGDTGGELSTEGFPNTDGTTEAVAFEETGHNLYRRVMEQADTDPIPARMFLAALPDHQIVVYLDGEEVMRKDAGDRGLHWVDVDYPPYQSQLAIDVIPTSDPTSGPVRWGWSWIELLPAADGEGEPELGQVLRTTYHPTDHPQAAGATPWRNYRVGANDYPGVTPGFILRVLLEEWQARGGITEITYDFTDELDSAGNAWPTAHEFSNAPGVIEMAVQVGDDNVLSVAERLRDHGVNFALGADLVFHAWQDRGVDRGGTPESGASTVTFPLTMARDVSVETEDETINTALVRTKRSWLIRPGAPPARRREGFLALGMIPSDEGGERTADSVLAALDESRWVGQFTVNSSQSPPIPTTGYDIGDVVVGPYLPLDSLTSPWTEDDVRIATVAASVDEVGDIDWVIETTRPLPEGSP